MEQQSCDGVVCHKPDASRGGHCGHYAVDSAPLSNKLSCSSKTISKRLQLACSDGARACVTQVQVEHASHVNQTDFVRCWQCALYSNCPPTPVYHAQT